MSVANCFGRGPRSKLNVRCSTFMSARSSMTQNYSNLKDLGPTGLARLMEDMGQPAYRGHQIGSWLYAHDVTAIADMRNLPRSLREELGKGWHIPRASLKRMSCSTDGSKKLLVDFDQGSSVETVYMPMEHRTTLCLSTQTGCPIGCTFCATAQLGSGRILSLGEIIEQLQITTRSEPHGAGLPKPTHLVFMGMGEPLLQPEITVEALRVLLWEHGFDYGKKRITVSTCGILKGIEMLRKSGLGVGLALSLNSPWEDQRRQLMPNAPPLTDIVPELRAYALSTGRRVTLEYVLLGGVNDSPAHAKALASLARTLPSKINLIPFNPFPGTPFTAPSEEQMVEFLHFLQPRVAAVTLRRSMARDVHGACGQLAGLARISQRLSWRD